MCSEPAKPTPAWMVCVLIKAGLAADRLGSGYKGHRPDQVPQKRLGVGSTKPWRTTGAVGFQEAD